MPLVLRVLSAEGLIVYARVQHTCTRKRKGTRTHTRTHTRARARARAPTHTHTHAHPAMFCNINPLQTTEVLKKENDDLARTLGSLMKD